MKNLKMLWMLFLTASVIGIAQTPLYAENIIANRDGEIKIEEPDGSVFNVGIDKNVGDLPSGSTIYTLSASMTIAPVKGSLKVVAGPSTAVIEAGSGATVYYNKNNQTAYFEDDAGEITITTAGTTTVLNKKGEGAAIKLNEETNAAEVKTYRV